MMAKYQKAAIFIAIVPLVRGNITPPANALFARATPNSCQANCSVDVSFPMTTLWQAMVFSTTIVAATVSEIVNTISNTTKTVTNYNDLPSGYTLPPTNSAGTHVETVSIFAGAGTYITTELAYPTGLIDWADEYSWSGVLETSNKGGVPSCVTVTDSSVVLLTFTAPKSTVPPLTTDASLGVVVDPEGLLYSLVTNIGYATEYGPYLTDAAFMSCSLPTPTTEAMAELTARFVTHRTKIFEDSGPTPSASPRLQGQNPAQSSTTPAPSSNVTPAVQSPSQTPEPSSSPAPVPGSEPVIPAISSPPPVGPVQPGVSTEPPQLTAASTSSVQGLGNSTAIVNSTAQPTIEVSNDSKIVKAGWHSLWLPVALVLILLAA